MDFECIAEPHMRTTHFRALKSEELCLCVVSNAIKLEVVKGLTINDFVFQIRESATCDLIKIID